MLAEGCLCVREACERGMHASGYACGCLGMAVMLLLFWVELRSGPTWAQCLLQWLVAESRAYVLTAHQISAWVPRTPARQ